MSFIEYDPDALAFDPLACNAVEQFNKDVSYFIDGREHTVTYVTDAEAIVAYNEFIAFQNRPRAVNVGDVVRLRGAGNKRIAENISYVVQNVPTVQFPWWGLLGSQTNTVYIMQIGDGRLLEIDPTPTP